MDALAVAAHPPADLGQDLLAFLGNIAPAIRAEVQKEIAALADALDQLFDNHVRRLEILIQLAVAPVVVDRHAGFPHDALAQLVEQAVRRNDLLGADKVTAEFVRMRRHKRAEAVAAAFEAVVEHDLRLQLAHHAHQLCRLPRFADHIRARRVRIGIVQPEHVNLAVIRHQLAHLPVHVRKIAVKIAALVGDIGAAAVRMVDIGLVHEIRMVPVDDRVVQAHAEALGAERIDKLADQIAAAVRRRLEIRQLRVKQAEAVVMLGDHDRVFHARVLRHPRPFFRIIVLGRKFLCKRLVFLRRDLLDAPDPFAVLPSGNGVDPPVDIKPEPGLGKPCRALTVGLFVKFVHSFLLFCLVCGAQPLTAPPDMAFTKNLLKQQNTMIGGSMIMTIAESMPL